MEFGMLLAGLRLPAETVALCLHKPGDPRERNALARMAASEPDLFDAYQRTHPRIAEATLKARRVMASFLSRGDGTLMFLGLWRQEGWAERSATEFDADPQMRAMLDRIGAERFAQGLGARAEFTLTAMDALGDLRGRLIVADPGARAYMRLAETTPLTVVEVTRTADFAPPMPGWETLVLDTPTLKALPAGWSEVLRQWRGIYLITDTQDGARYVGSASGEENLLGRWQQHVAGPVGVTAQLSRRDPARFLFSILELLSPVAPHEAVIRAEHHWMTRLHTRKFGLNS